MTLNEHYNTLKSKETIAPKKKLVLRIAKECGVDMSNVYRWINGGVVPDKLKREKVSEIIGIPAEELFAK